MTSYVHAPYPKYEHRKNVWLFLGILSWLYRIHEGEKVSPQKQYQCKVEAVLNDQSNTIIVFEQNRSLWPYVQHVSTDLQLSTTEEQRF
jgi:hypothetical protein